jgi:hypothetical protein
LCGLAFVAWSKAPTIYTNRSVRTFRRSQWIVLK